LAQTLVDVIQSDRRWPMLAITNFTGHPPDLQDRFRQSETRGDLSLARACLDQGSPTAGPMHTIPHGLSR
jgi:hypothetical protein